MKSVQLLIVVVIAVLVILVLLFCERKKRVQKISQQEEEDCSSECVKIDSCTPPAPPLLQEIPTLFRGFDEGDNEQYEAGLQDGPNTWNWPFINLETYLVPDACTTARPTAFSTINFLMGTVQLDPSNSNPAGGYIMSTMTDQKDYTLIYDQVPMSSALTQAQFDGGEFFIWGMPVDNNDFPPTTYPVNTFAVSEWVDLNATYNLVGDTLVVTWSPIEVDGSLGPWEIVVTARDNSLACRGSGTKVFYSKTNLGDIVPINQTSLTIQLSSGPGGLEHDISAVAAYAYPLCNKSEPSTFYIESAPIF